MMDLTAILSNQVFSGVAGAAIVSAALFQLRSIPSLVGRLLSDQFSATLTVYSEQDVFRHIDMWLGRHPSAGKTRRVAVTEWWDQAGSRTEQQMTPGEGPHLLWEGMRPVFINKVVEQAPPTSAAPGSSTRRQTIVIKTVGRSRELLEQILAEARTVQDRDVVPIYLWGGFGYDLIERRARRTVETIYLAGHLRDTIIEDAKRFIGRRTWYAERGIPHRRGYLFEGPPGTGKSSMALALAGELRRSIYIINPSAVSDDNVLQMAINQAGSGVVLIEDIDAIDCGLERKPAPDSAAASSASGISTSGLLNAIDGVAARDGRILVITSNHPEKLDLALIRPGRVDMRCHFGLAREPEARAMFSRLCPGGSEGEFAEVVADLPLSQAEIQNRLLRIAA